MKRRCVHCLDYFDNVTMDHAIPKVWYPDSTPATTQRWTAPCCEGCNKELDKIEKRVFQRFGQCITPGAPETAGLAEKALRIAGIGSGNLSDREKRIRAGIRSRLVSEMKPAPDSSENVLPGFGPHPEVPVNEQFTFRIQPADLHALIEKAARGSEHFLMKGRYVERDHEVPTDCLPDKEALSRYEAILGALGKVHKLAPGLEVTRAESGTIVVYRFYYLGTSTAYAYIRPIPAG